MDIIKLVLTHPKIDPGCYSNLAIIALAVKICHINIVEFLLTDPRINPIAEDNRALIFAAVYDKPDCIKLLCEDPRVGLKANGASGLRWALKKNNMELILSLTLKHSRIRALLKLVSIQQDVLGVILDQYDNTF